MTIRETTGTRPRDFAVIGAGTFGAWTALHLRKLGRSVVLIDGYGAGNSRASSGGESRVIRMGYGPDDIYTEWAQRSLVQWKELSAEVSQVLFHDTGVLWMAQHEDPMTTRSLQTLAKRGIPHERLERGELERRYPQIDFGSATWAVLEPDSGVLMARRAVQATVREATRRGVEYFEASVEAPRGGGRVEGLGAGGVSVHALVYVFACGPWLPKLFPDLLGDRIFPTRQEVFYFGPPSDDPRYRSPALPVWMDFGHEAYGMPDLEGRGFKAAFDRHGPRFDPDTGERLVSEAGLREMRAFLARRFPGLKDAPLVASEVCQYENTSNGDFLVDRHPAFENVWLVGGGSGHGFKHGPALGEYVAGVLAGEGAVEGRFSLSTKETLERRSVY